MNIGNLTPNRARGRVGNNKNVGFCNSGFKTGHLLTETRFIFMKKLILLTLLLLASASPSEATAPKVRFALTVHSEAPGGGSKGVPITPSFASANKTTYLKWREAILTFAGMCKARTLAWQFETDYNFLEGVRRFEVSTGANYDAAITNGTRFDLGLGRLTTDTGGKNVIKYLHEDLGVNLDPHSHESNGYNYADVAWLINVGCDTASTAVVGGHVYTGEGFQDWEKFVRSANGLEASQHSGYFWKPHLLMGGGTAAHVSDPHVSGLWRPQDTDHYFTHSASQTMAAVGNWEQDFMETDRLLGMLEDGTLPHNEKLWTVGRVLNHRDFVQTGYLSTTAAAVLDTIVAWRDAGRFQVKTWEDIYSEWLAAPFSGQPSLYERPLDNISFSLNWQDFCYTPQSNTELRTLLNYHEAKRVPVDVFLTTWQTDILESEAPELLGRLISSRWVNMAYHVRAPKPYANGYTWRSVTSNDIADYERFKLDKGSGQWDSSTSGGFTKLSSLYGAAPRIAGPNADIACAQLVYDYFKTAGASMLVVHDSEAAVVFGTQLNNGLWVRPESYDWRLIEYYAPPDDVAPSATSIDDAFSKARTTAGTAPPYFVGVKLHDNDLFATQSAWTAIFGRVKPYMPPWYPENHSYWAGTLAPSETIRRRNFYLNTVAEAASRRASINLMDARDMLSMLAGDKARPLGLSNTEMPEEMPVGTTIATISGGGIESGLHCTYSLVSGDGADDNADFSISGSNLLVARTLDYETKRVRHLRMRWQDAAGNSGERALTVVLAPRPAVGPCEMSGTTFTLSWSSDPGKVYHLEYSTDLVSWITIGGSSVQAEDTTTTQTLSGVSGARLFYRVVVD